MKSQGISELESQLARARSIESRREDGLAQSDSPSVERIFLASASKHREDLERELYLAKAERAYEVLRLRLNGPQLSMGTIRLRALAKIAPLLNSLLEQSAWRVWDESGDADRIDEKFVRLVDLRLADLQPGSTELVVVGNTSPDLSGLSALETALRNIFDLLGSSADQLAHHLNDVGTHAAKSLAELLSFFERENVAAGLQWTAADQAYQWDGRPAEITRVRAMLDDVGEPRIEQRRLLGRVQVLSIRGRMEVLVADSEEKVRITYHRSLTDAVNDLHLDQRKVFVVERTEYPIKGAKRKGDAFRLVAIEDP